MNHSQLSNKKRQKLILFLGLFFLLLTNAHAKQFSFIINGKSFHQNRTYEVETTTIDYTCREPAPQNIDPNNVPSQCREVNREVSTTDEQYNEDNTGYGLLYEFDKRKNVIPYVTFGKYIDSFDTDATYLSAGASKRIILSRQLDNLHFEFGGALTLIKSTSYREGRPILTFMPVLSLATDMVGLNLSYIPKINNTTTHVFFIQMKVSLTD